MKADRAESGKKRRAGRLLALLLLVLVSAGLLAAWLTLRRRSTAPTPPTTSPSAAPAAAESWRVGSEARDQTLAGCGGPRGWVYPPQSIREEVADLLFDDLGVSLLRVRALGRNDDPTGDEGALEQENDNDDPLTFRWAGFDFAGCEEEQARLCQAARRRGVRLFVAAAWSPPGWMKDNASRVNGGAVKEDCYEEFAELWAAYLIGMRKRYDVEFTHLTLLNEPDVIPRPYPCCVMDAEPLARLAGVVARRLEREKLSTRLLGPDTSRPYNFVRYAERQLAEPAAAARSRELSTHLYRLDRDFYAVEENRADWQEIAACAERAGRPVWLTEFSNYAGAFSGGEPASAREALAWAHHLHLALTAGNCAAVCYWGLFFDKPEESLLYARTSHATEYVITPKYHTTKQYFRFVRPGMVRLGVTPPREASPDVLVSAFAAPRGRNWSVVAVNLSQEERRLDLRLRRSSDAPLPRSLNRLRTIAGAAGVVLSPLALAAGAADDWLSDRLPPGSVTTYTTFPTRATPALDRLRGARANRQEDDR